MNFRVRRLQTSGVWGSQQLLSQGLAVGPIGPITDEDLELIINRIVYDITSKPPATIEWE